MAARTRKLWFYAIINENQRTTQRLVLPPKFVEDIPEVPDNATLKGPSGDQWHVKLSKKGNKIYISDGWQQFVSDNSLGKDEFLIFKYSRGNKFDIQIFERTGVERVEFDFYQGCSIQGKKSHGETIRPHKVMKDEDIRVRSAAKEVNPSDIVVKENYGCGRDKKRATKILHNTKQRLPSSKEESARIKRVLQSFSSEFPYFWVFMRESYVEKRINMPIPMAFSREHLANSRKQMILQNSERKSWKVDCICSRNTNFLTKGFSPFISDNNFKIGDICIFELVASNKMQVHVFH